jgi:hypothetical protein
MIAGLLGCSGLWLDVFDLLVSRVHCGRLAHVYLVGLAIVAQRSTSCTSGALGCISGVQSGVLYPNPSTVVVRCYVYLPLWRLSASHAAQSVPTHPFSFANPSRATAAGPRAQ